MDARRFDRLAIELGRVPRSRRGALRWLGASVLGALGAGVTGRAGAAAAARCVPGNEACGQPRQCCSGICRRGKCRRSRGRGICTVADDSCRGPFARCDDGTGDFCLCVVTTRGASFCTGGGVCARCRNDKECVAVTGPGSRCTRCAGPAIGAGPLPTLPDCRSVGGTACEPPCASPR